MCHRIHNFPSQKSEVKVIKRYFKLPEGRRMRMGGFESCVCVSLRESGIMFYGIKVSR